jgi:ribosome-associated toxin RatA of RatAB toxin-antitoxin module
MINFSHTQKLNFPIKQFFNTITKVNNYKNFLPWCIDSYEKDHKIHLLTYKEIQNKFPDLEKNIHTSTHLNKKFNINNEQENKKENLIKIKTYEGCIKVGFDLVDFSYISKVYAISDNIVLSITDDSQSHIFSKLESVWILEEDSNPDKLEKLNIDYHIQFKMKSILFSRITSLCMSFLGENIVKSFISQTEKVIKEKEENEIINNNNNVNFNNNKIDFNEEMINNKKKLENLIKRSFETLALFEDNSDKLKEKIKILFSYFQNENILSIEELEILVNKSKKNISTKFQLLHFIDICDENNLSQIRYIGKDLKDLLNMNN